MITKTLNFRSSLNSPTSSTITIADTKTLMVSNSLTLAGTDNSTLTIGGGGTLGTAAYTDAATYVTAVTGTSPVLSSGGTTPVISIPAATASVNGYMTTTYATKLDGIAAGATANLGTVTSLSVVTANGFTGSVATDTTTPAITLSTSVSGVLMGSTGAITQAALGTDYMRGYPATDSTTAIQFKNAAQSTTLMTFDTTNARVGVGTVAPAYPLHVSGDIGVSGYFRNGQGGNPARSNFIGNLAGSSATSATDANFIGTNAGNGATSATFANFIGNLAGTSATSATYANFIGYQAGLSATSANNSNFIGANAGWNASGANNSNFFGSSAGQGATSAFNSNFIGWNAGVSAPNANNSNFIGSAAGFGATSAYGSNFIGQNTGNSATGASSSNFIGYACGSSATSATFANFIGWQSGSSATSATYANFIGAYAGISATSANNSNFIGQYAGGGATSASDSNFFGQGAGYAASSAYRSNFIGRSAGAGAAMASDTNAFGFQSGYQAYYASMSSFIGYQAGYQATNASNSIFIGFNAGNSDKVNNNAGTTGGAAVAGSIAIGHRSGTGSNLGTIPSGSGTLTSGSNVISAIATTYLGVTGYFGVNQTVAATGLPTGVGTIVQTASSTTTVAAAVDTSRLTLVSVTGFAIGQPVTTDNEAIWLGTTILAISGTTITLSRRLFGAVSAGGTVRTWPASSAVGSTTLQVTWSSGIFIPGQRITGANIAPGATLVSGALSASGSATLTLSAAHVGSVCYGTITGNTYITSITGTTTSPSAITLSNSSTSTSSAVAITCTGNFRNSIAIGRGVQNSAQNQLNIGNTIYASGIFSNEWTLPETPSLGAKVGIGVVNPAYTLDVAGDFRTTAGILGGVTVTSSTTTLASQTYYIFSGSAAVAWTLPSMVANVGRMYFVKNRGSANVTVTAASGQYIYAAASAGTYVVSAGESAMFVSDGAFWNVMASYAPVAAP